VHQSNSVADALTVAMPTLGRMALARATSGVTGAQRLWAELRLPIALIGATLVLWLVLSSLARPAAPSIGQRSTPTAPAPQQTSQPRQSSASEAAAEVRGVISAGLSARDISSDAASEILKKVDEAMEKLADRKAGDAVKEVGEARRKLIEFEEKREVAAARATAIRQALDDLSAALEQRL
jgi:hypothetical protein